MPLMIVVLVEKEMIILVAKIQMVVNLSKTMMPLDPLDRFNQDPPHV